MFLLKRSKPLLRRDSLNQDGPERMEKKMSASMRFVHTACFSVMLLCGLCSQVSAKTILNDPLCLKALAPEELANLQSCVERGALCTKYWPTQTNDLQKCDAAAAWVRTARTWPLSQRQEAFGADGLLSPAAVLPSPEPAWKRLPRSGNPSATSQINIPGNVGTNPYAGTSSAITPQEAERVGWNVNIITGAIKMAGQMAQDKTAMESPEAAAEAKAVLDSIGLREYAASDEAIEKGRRLEAEARTRAYMEQAAAAEASSAATPVLPGVITTSKNPYESNDATSATVGSSAGISTPSQSQAQSQRLPYRANANSCISLRGSQLVNNCSKGVWIEFCVTNPRQTANFFDGSDSFRCPKKGGLDSIAANSVYGLVLHGWIKYFACFSSEIATMKTIFWGDEPHENPHVTEDSGGYQGLCGGPGASGKLEMGSAVYAK